MKIRNGFVSNSSSSSFVCIGARMSEKQLKELGWCDEDGITENVPEGFEVLYTEYGDGDIVGIVLASGEDSLDNVELTEYEISKTMAKVEKVLGKPVKLFIGTRPC